MQWQSEHVCVVMGETEKMKLVCFETVRDIESIEIQKTTTTAVL